MKSLSILIFFLLSFHLGRSNNNYFQNDSLPLVGNKVTYTGIMELDSIKKGILYKNAIVFFRDYVIRFNNGLNYTRNKIENPISYSADDSSELIVNLKIRLEGLNMERLYSFIVRLKFKDNKYKYEVSDFVQLGVNTGIIAGPLYGEAPIEDFYKKSFKKKNYIAFNNQIKKFLYTMYEALRRKGQENW